MDDNQTILDLLERHIQFIQDYWLATKFSLIDFKKKKSNFKK